MKPRRFDTAEFVNDKAISTGEAILEAAIVYNNHATDTQFVQFHDRKTKPTTGDKPLYFFKVEAGKSEAIDIPIPFKDGIWMVSSSTAGTFTEVATANIWPVGVITS